MRACRACGDQLPIADFRRDKRTRTGHGLVCEDCFDAPPARPHPRMHRERRFVGLPPDDDELDRVTDWMDFGQWPVYES